MSSPLKPGDSGDSVKALQQALLTAGFNPGAIDGNFGNGTEAAVLAFQRSEKFVPDGIVGPTTAAALHLAEVPELPSAIPAVTTQIVSQMFPSTPIGNISANLPTVLSALAAAELADQCMVLMALGTIRAETEAFKPLCEGESRFNTSPSGHPFDLYDNRKDLGNQGPPDGARYCGRGFVQLTGRLNYTRYSQEIGQDLVNKPELANDPAIAAQLLARFLSDREDAIRHAITNNDLATARRLVNGGSNGLDRFTDAYQKGAALLG